MRDDRLIRVMERRGRGCTHRNPHHPCIRLNPFFITLAKERYATKSRGNRQLDSTSHCQHFEAFIVSQISYRIA